MNKKYYILILPLILIIFLFSTTNEEKFPTENNNDESQYNESNELSLSETKKVIEPIEERSQERNKNLVHVTSQTSKDKKTFELIKSDKSGTTLSFSLPEYSIETVELPNGKIYAKINASGQTRPLNQKGYPALPIYKQEILIPADANPQLIVSTSNFQNMSIGTPIPAVGPISRKKQLPEPSESKFYDSSEVFPKTAVSLKSSYTFRGLRAVTVTVSPFCYDNSTQTVQVYNNIEFSIKTVDSSEIIMGKPLKIADFQRSASESFVNYEAASTEYIQTTSRSLPETEVGKLLIVHHSRFTDTITDFVKWKKMIGFDVETAIYPTDTGLGIESLKTFIDSKYENGTSHVILMGEADDIPSRTYLYENDKWYNDSNYNIDSPGEDANEIVYSDIYYAGIDLPGLTKNSDYIQDLYISRFSTSSTISLQKQLQRTINYERGATFEATDSSWLNSVLLTASSQGGGSSYNSKADYQHLNYQETLLTPNTDYSSFTKVYDGFNPQVSTVISSLNDGAGLTYYLGHGGYDRWITTGFNATHVAQLNTALPTLAIQPVCQTGGFFTNCFAESQMNSENFIGVFASTNNTLWNPPMVQIEEMTKNLIADSYQTVGGIIFDSLQQAVLWTNQTSYAEVRDCTSAQLHYFGDCSMGFRTKQPQCLTVKVNKYVNPNSSFKVQLSVNGTPVVNGSIAMTHGTELTTAKTNAFGEVQFMSPSDVENFKITAWERNSIAVEKEVQLSPSYTVNKSIFQAGDELINLNAIVPGTEISSDLFIVENGILKADSNLNLSEQITLNITYRDKDTGEFVTTKISISYDSPASYQFKLYTGWNLIGSPVNSSIRASEVLIDKITRYSLTSTIYYWDDTNYQYLAKELSTYFPEQSGFWAYSNQDAESPEFTGTSSIGAMTSLHTGWNLYSPATYHPVPEGCLAIWEWDPQGKIYIEPTKPLLTPAKGYWIFMDK